ncbi:MAG: transcriptional regulator GcvA [Hyphomicrobiales bacterium]
MVYRLPPLNALRAFEATARHMSFSRAAEELNLTPSALSYQVRMLEEFLSVKLFTRLNRAIELTDHGQRVFPGVRESFQLMSKAMSRLTADTPDHILVVSTGPSFAAKWLTPRIVSFMEACPDLEMRVSASLALIDFVEDRVDVSVRFGAGRYEGLHAERLVGDWTTPMVAPQLLEGENALRTPADIANHTLLHDDSIKYLPNAPVWKDWLQEAGVSGIDTGKGARFNHADHALNAAAKGSGVVLGRGVLAADDLEMGRLVMPFPEITIDTGFAFYFVCPPTMLHRPKVQQFREWVFDEFAKDPIPRPPAR